MGGGSTIRALPRPEALSQHDDLQPLQLPLRPLVGIRGFGARRDGGGELRTQLCGTVASPLHPEGGDALASSMALEMGPLVAARGHAEDQ